VITLGNVDPIKDALFLTDPYVDRESLVSQKGWRVPGTCEWITRHPKYQSWLQNGEQLLWISGGPGKGKTMMSIFLTEELEKTTSASNGLKSIFYFCSIQDEKRNTALAILRSLIHQIITQTPHLAKHAQAHFGTDDRMRQTLSSFETLWIILRSIVTDKSLPITLCVLDGIDEADDQARELLVPRFVNLLPAEPSINSTCTFRLAIVSRNIPGLSGCVQVKLDPDHDKDVAQDIESFVSVTIKDLPAPKQDEIAFRTQIRETLLDRAKGTFLWVGFAMHELRKKRTSIEILSALEELPSGLENIYGAMLLRIPSGQREMSFRILTWVTMAFRPPSLKELAAAVDIRSSSSMITQEQAVYDAVKLCAPLLKMQQGAQKRVWDKNSRSYIEVSDIERVNLIHASARDYLLRKEPDDNPILEKLRIKQEEAHLNTAQTCLRCIIFSESRHKVIPVPGARDPEKAALLQYSSFYWYEHVRLCPTRSDELFKQFEVFFRRSSEVRDDWYSSLTVNMWAFAPPQLHMASQFGVIPWIRWILHRPKWSPTFRSRKNEKDKQGNTALLVAILHGREEAARLLINKGLDILVKNRDGNTALQISLSHGRKELVLLLIKFGAATNGRKVPQFPIGIGKNINSKDDIGFTILHYTARCDGLESEIRMLIQNGADVGALTVRNSETALHFAAKVGNEATLQTLIASGANIEAMTEAGNTALHVAAYHGRKEAARTLIEHGANIEAKNKVGQTALHLALYPAQNVEEVVQMLIDHGANLEAKNDHGQTARERAFGNGHDEVVRLLDQNLAAQASMPQS
jgi:ankyrin repeat protein